MERTEQVVTRVLTIRCRECDEVARVTISKDAPVPRYRVVHGDQHVLQEWVDAVPVDGEGLTWDKSKWG